MDESCGLTDKAEKPFSKSLFCNSQSGLSQVENFHRQLTTKPMKEMTHTMM